MIPEVRGCFLPAHTTRPYLTNWTYRENAGALQPLLRRLDRTPPPIGAADRPDDLNAGGEASLNRALRQSLRPVVGINRRGHLQVAVVRHVVTSPGLAARSVSSMAGGWACARRSSQS